MSKNKCSFTFYELASFIWSQPDEKEVDMLEGLVTGPRRCGCVLVHFARERLGVKDDRIHCGWDSIQIGNKPLVKGDKETGSFIYKASLLKKTTYQPIKALLPPPDKAEQLISEDDPGLLDPDSVYAGEEVSLD